MDEKLAEPEVGTLPLAPRNPLPYLDQVRALRTFHTGCETLRDAGGPVTRLTLAPKWLMPPAVVVTSPQGACDVLGRTDAYIEKARVHDETRHLLPDMGHNMMLEPEWAAVAQRIHAWLGTHQL